MQNNFNYLLSIRTIAMTGQLLALVAMHQFFGISLPLMPVVTILFALALFTFVSWHYYRRVSEVSESSFTFQLAVDLLALTLLVYYTGGSANPFIFLFILPIIFAAASMRAALTAVLTLTAVTCYTFLMFFHVPIAEHHTESSGIALHIWGMWYGFVLSAGLVSYYVSRIAQTLRERDAALATAREEALRAEQMVTLGTLAAGTAHELGTPLSTMAILIKELELEALDKNIAEDLHLIRSQIDRCKAILNKMSSDAGQLQAIAGHAIAIDNYLQDITDEWRLLRSQMNVSISWQGSRPVPVIIADQTLTHAIVNVLDNAADASAKSVEINGRWTEDKLTLCVSNDGKNLSSETKDAIGQEILQGKTEGLGIGLYLAQTTLTRLGGRIDFTNLQPDGVMAKIELPLQTLLASDD
ncbi:MAG: hypothetical protein GKR93_01795 [Gammaproteobacteria bacterium]|nr:hypothetical protein [Gammaproteobacteria bacterium]